jgi:hypothetical protein
LLIDFGIYLFTNFQISRSNVKKWNSGITFRGSQNFFLKF